MTDAHLPRPDAAPIGDALRRSFDGRDPDALQPDLVRLMLELSHERPAPPAAEPEPAGVTGARVARSWWWRALMAMRR